MKKYEIGQNRFVVIKNHKDSPTVSLVENGTTKSAEFPFARWECLTRVYVPLIEEAVKQLEAGLDVSYRQHIGGKWYVSVTKGYACVDFREFYWHPLIGEKPTKRGIALRLYEWKKLVEILSEIQKQNPALGKTPTCWDLLDHNDPEVMKNCAECNPFQFETG